MLAAARVEVPVEGDTIDWLAARHGGLADALGESDLDGNERELLRGRIIAAAARVLTAGQLQLLTLYLSGKSPTDIAKLTGRSQPTVSIMLHGRRGPRAQRGILGRVADELSRDEEFLAMVKRIRSSSTSSGRPDVARWYAGIPAGRTDHFIARAALLSLVAVADAKKRRLTIDDAYEILPRPVVSLSLPILRVGGWIRTDGRTIEILRTPVEPPVEEEDQ